MTIADLAGRISSAFLHIRGASVWLKMRDADTLAIRVDVTIPPTKTKPASRGSVTLTVSTDMSPERADEVAGKYVLALTKTFKGSE